MSESPSTVFGASPKVCVRSFSSSSFAGAFATKLRRTTLFINFGEQETAYCLPFVAKARTAGIRTEMYPDQSKMKKQMSYANAKEIPFVALAGENEMAQGKLTLKNMATGEQMLVSPEELIAQIK